MKDDDKPSAMRRALSWGVPLMAAMKQMQHHFTHAKHEDEVKVKRERTLKRTMTVLLSALFVLLLLIGTLKLVVRLKELALGMASMVGAEVPKDENGFTNVLLLGEGDSDHDGVDLTDTIMVASLDPGRTKSAVMLSIPRDTYLLNTEKMGKGRVNSLYRDYKIALTRKGEVEDRISHEAMTQLGTEIGNLLGMQIHGVVKVNFSGFEQAVDAIGGIDVDVPYDLVDPEYPGPNYTYETFSLPKGPQHLDGATALKYARSRHSTSDFSRSGRQQQIIAAAAKKVKEDGVIKNVGRLTELLGILAKNVESTFSTRELLGLASLGQKLDTGRMISEQLNDQNGLYGTSVEQGGFLYSPPRDQFDGAAVLLPVSIPEFPVTWKQIKLYATILTTKREAFLNPPRLVVTNAGAKEGTARKFGGELYRYSFNVVQTRNYAKSPNETFDTSFIAINPSLLTNDDAMASTRKRVEWNAAYLSSVTGIKLQAAPNGRGFEDGSPDIVIALGKDFGFSPLQDLVKP